MKRKRTSTRITSTTFDGYFPAEILTEILAKLPVKSLLRFRCVSKFWRDLIDNPNFTSIHLNHTKTKHQNQKYYPILGLQWPARKGCSFTTRSCDNFRRNGELVRVSENSYPRASVDGLILLRQIIWRENLRLWNPSIRKSLVIPAYENSSMNDVYVVGFAASSNEYKVVSFQFCGDTENFEPSFAVYGLSDGCWRRSTWGMDVLDWNSWTRSEGLSTKGAAYWLMAPRGNGSKNQKFILLFDFSNEEFSFVGLPDDGGEETVRFLFLMRESVAVLCVTPVSICIWVMEDKDEEKLPWTKWYSGDITFDEYKLFKKCGWKMLFVEKNGLFWMIESRRVLSYSIRTHEIRQVAKSIPVVDMFMHVESLLLCRGLEGQTLTSFP